MIGTVGAIIASAVIGGGVALLAANQQSQATDKAVVAQTNSVDKQIAAHKESEAQVREDQRPWREAGQQALAQLQAGIADGSFDPTNFDFQADPGYQFRAEQGTKAMERSAAAKGNLFSAGTQVAIADFGQNLASNEYDRAYARNAAAKTTNFNSLAAVAGTGQRATEVSSAATQTAGNNITDATAQGGNAIANGYLQQGQVWANGLNNVAGAANTGIQNYLLHNALGTP